MLKKIFNVFKIFVKTLVSKFIYYINFIEILIYSNNIIKYINTNKIYKICIFYEGGFGVLNTLCERVYQNKERNFLIINFYEKGRFHNKYISNFFSNLDIINIYLFSSQSKIFSFLKNYDPILKQKLFNLLKKKILRFDQSLKVFDQNLIYKLNTLMMPEQIKSNKLNKMLLWQTKKYECPTELNKIFYRQISIKPDKKILNIIQKNIGKFYLTYKKNFCIHIRNKYPIIKNNGSINDYISSIKYLLKNKFNIFIVGEFDLNENVKILIENNNRIFTAQKFNIPKDIFDFYFLHFCKYSIVSQSGAMTVPTYSNKFIYLPNFYPLSLTFPNSLILYKKIIKNNKQKYTHKCIQQLDSNFNNKSISSYEIVNNSDKEILNGLIEYLSIFKMKSELIKKQYFLKNLNSKLTKYNPLYSHEKFKCLISKQDIKKFIIK